MTTHHPTNIRADGYPPISQPEPLTMRYVPDILLRDYLAAKALQGVLYMVAHGVHSPASSAEGCAKEAYILADAMLAARGKP